MSQLEKWKACSDKFQIIKEFLSFAHADHNLQLAELEENFNCLHATSTLSSNGAKTLLYEFFDIDEQKLEDERRKILEGALDIELENQILEQE